MWPPPAVVQLLLVGAAVLVAAHLFNVLVPHDVEFLEYQLDLDRELNVPTWFASMVWMLAALAAAIWARVTPRLGGEPRWILFLPAAGLLLLSVDEVAGLHEMISDRLDRFLPGGIREGTFFANTGIWMFVLVPVAVAIVLWMGWRLRAHVRATPAAAVLYAAAAACMVIGVGFVELTTNLFDRESIAYNLVVLVEEAAELLAGTLAVWGGVELLRSIGVLPLATVRGV